MDFLSVDFLSQVFLSQDFETFHFLSQVDFLHTLSENLSKDMLDRVAELRRVTVFDRNCSEHHLMAVAPFFTFVPFRKGQVCFFTSPSFPSLATGLARTRSTS